ncbi:MAG: hypothetical protein ACUVXJ_14085 [Phycisphaerae bacterium]
MEGPGEYLPDVTEGIARVEDLPEPRIVKQSRNDKRQPCPACGRSSYRDRIVTRALHDLGDLKANRPAELRITASQHYCSHCDICFNTEMDDLALPKAHYTYWMVSMAVRRVVEDGLPCRTASWHLWRDHRLFVPFATIQTWVEAGEKRRSEKWPPSIWTRP